MRHLLADPINFQFDDSTSRALLLRRQDAAREIVRDMQFTCSLEVPLKRVCTGRRSLRHSPRVSWNHGSVEREQVKLIHGCLRFLVCLRQGSVGLSTHAPRRTIERKRGAAMLGNRVRRRRLLGLVNRLSQVNDYSSPSRSPYD